MSTDREATRVVRSWLEEGVTVLPDRVLDAVLDQVPTTPQRRSWWPAWRFSDMNTYAKLLAAAAAVLVVAVVGYQLIPGTSGPGGATTAPSPSPALLAVGNFTSHGASTQLDATGDGSNVTGTMTVSDEGGRFTVDLGCSRTTDGGLIMIGGPVTESTHEMAPQGSHVAIILQRGSPVEAIFWFQADDPPPASCPEFLESIPDEHETGEAVLEPIQGTIQLRP